MTITEYINRKGIEALLDNRQDLCKGLLHAARLATGSRCPEGHGGDEISFDNDGQAHCAACDEVYSLVEAACNHLQGLGYDVYAEGL
jgi:hypothetical protein